ncbi:MAG: uroporphyrinogen-III synthase, partial [Romboutsia sp.]|uniref:uroporphyrinogen-III synthase n=1 Tax=Romboutsia sp. TaxID=1965302 RepID=UPI003F2D7641
YSYLVLTSKNGVEIFFDKLKEMNLDCRALANIKVCAIGPATAKAIIDKGINPDIIPKKFVAESLYDELKPLLSSDDKILIPRAKNARDYLVDRLREVSEVTEIHTYETTIDDSKKDEIIELLEEENIDYITFASSSTASNFVEIINRSNIDKLNDVKIISIGPITSNTIKELNLKLYREAKEATIDSMIEVMLD